MLQREVADRLVASPGSRDYGVLTIMLALAAELRKLLDLPPGAFRPAPKVRSSVVALAFRPSPVRISDEQIFETVTKRIFSQRRKTLANGLKGLVADPSALLQDAGIAPMRRAETLTLAELARLADHVAGTRRAGVL
jgi:16S rRNA (adenine1518-N6/adenine1519-N6)-dimethyltransferase